MGKRKSPNKASDREKKWDKVFNALVKLSQNLQNDRQFLEDRVKSLNGVIYMMKMEKKVESAKTELMLGLKERDALVYKHRYEQTDDVIEWFHCLAQKCPDPKDVSDDVSNKRDGSRNKALQEEVRKLKSELEKCKSEKKSEVTALLAEKSFVWNQLKIMENDFAEQLKKKRVEVQHANERAQALVNRAEELQISNEKLRTGLTKVESESVQKSEEIIRLSKEIELLKSSTPLLRSCRTEANKIGGGTNSTANRRVVTVKKESDPSQNIEKMSRTKRSAHKSTGGQAPKKQFMRKESSSSSSKRKLVDDDTPKLFTSSFKVPKLKSTSSLQIG
ncbi:hypothetical protein ABFS82_03G069700 [Erythranthe guttata]|uniref:testis-specific gene 10 protein n=1 Tax=Erythranthe guttata TaxID=4155 RepID=UPI00064DDDE8|nr:PREDICTED: testis-specific gene 10 protein [Erythranthe guttata]|eukprot:XP_012835693.1 PREDICTED: testis-specific gene 10 protein [Erythranthe guttata]